MKTQCLYNPTELNCDVKLFCGIIPFRLEIPKIGSSGYFAYPELNPLIFLFPKEKFFWSFAD